MLKLIVKKILRTIGVDIKAFIQGIAKFSLRLTLFQNNYREIIRKLQRIKPDISNQYSCPLDFNSFWETKLRIQHAFQCSLMLKALKGFPAGELTIVDIGDSARTHLRYLEGLTDGVFNIDSISVNCDSISVEKIKAQGHKAVLCNGEDFTLGDRKIDLVILFQIIEHLHNPIDFLKRLGKNLKCNRIAVTVPYLRKSRVGLSSMRKRKKSHKVVENEHIFELNPEDWKLLMNYTGWKIIHEQIYYQYPRWIPFLSGFLRMFMREIDFEGFWGVILERDTTLYREVFADFKRKFI